MIMNKRRINAIALRQFYLLRGSAARILPLFIWVAVDMILWGFISRYLNSINSAGFNFVSIFLGAVLLFDFFIRVMHGVTTAFFEDVWSRNFLNFFASPLLISEYLCGIVITSTITATLGLIVMLILATAIFGLSFASYGLYIFAFLLVLFLFGIALGILSAAVVLRQGPAAEWFIWPIPAIVSPFVGVFYPLSTLPHWMQGVSLLLPPSYVFEAMRAITQGDSSGADLGAMLLGATSLALFYIFLAYLAFVLVYRSAVKSGHLARYSAENIY